MSRFAMLLIMRFFEPYWRYYEAKTGEHVVELSGDITFQGKKKDMPSYNLL